LDNNRYKTESLIEIDVPKQNYILRPAARPCLVDWVIYNAIVNYIGSVIYKNIPQNSFSFNRFRDKYKNKSKYKSIDYWLEFEDKARELSESNKFSYMLVTDITSFFEHISLNIIGDRLKRLSNDSDYISAVNYLINNMLNKWTENNKIKNFGLPQGPTASTILADIYLYSLDKAMDKDKIKFIRYMDDFRIFAKNKNELKKHMIVMVRALRELKLNLNAKKTTIYKLDNKEELKKVFDPEKSRLSLIDSAFRSAKKDQILLVAPYLIELKKLAFLDSNFSERYLKFFIGRIIDLMRFNLIKKQYIKSLTLEFLDLFEEQHHLADLLCWFFVASSQYIREIKKIIQKRLITFICDRNKNIYEWQEMWALDTVRQLGDISRIDLNKLKKKIAKENPLCFSQFALILGSSGNNDDREEILESKRIIADQYRATILAIQELNQDVLNNANLQYPPYYQNYLKALRNKKYGFNYSLTHKDFDVETSRY